METMTREEAMKYCRYYGKVDMDKTPTSNDERFFYDYARIEKSWLNNITSQEGCNHNLKRYVEFYKELGLENFSVNDGVPISLKAYLYMRLTNHDERPERLKIPDFKGIYLNHYLKHAL